MRTTVAEVIHSLSGHLTTLTYSWCHDMQLILNQAIQRRIFVVKEGREDESGTWRSPYPARTLWLTAIVPYRGRWLARN
jgi:hypothetical protein